MKYFKHSTNVFKFNFQNKFIRSKNYCFIQAYIIQVISSCFLLTIKSQSKISNKLQTFLSKKTRQITKLGVKTETILEKISTNALVRLFNDINIYFNIDT